MPLYQSFTVLTITFTVNALVAFAFNQCFNTPFWPVFFAPMVVNILVEGLARCVEVVKSL